MEIRFAQPRDVSGILNLLLQVGQVHHEGRPDLFRSGACKYNASQILSLMADEKTPIFIAAEEGNVLGYGFCQFKEYKNDTVITDHVDLYIDDLCVDQNIRGRGIGKAIYQEVCRFAAQQGCYSVTLNVWCCNESAMKFYESLGLKPQKIGMENVLC